MDSWMPWTITRNFIRGFTPTLALGIAWDLYRNLSYLKPTRLWAVAVDVIALCIVIAIRLSPPLSAAREQIKHLFHGRYMACAFLSIALFSPKTLAIPANMLLMAASYALCNNLACFCKISDEDAELMLHRFYWVAGIVVFFIYCLVQSIVQMVQGTIVWRDIMAQALSAAVLILVLAFLKWWGNSREPIPHIQELGLNQSDTRKPA